MGKSLVIVESPAKARTIAKFLGDDYAVESSIGHIRDLPRSAAEIPSGYEGKEWARLGVDVDNDFKPLYVVNSDKKEQVRRLRALIKNADALYLATDEDREGEAIAWHLLEVLKPRIEAHRMVFHEITREAIQQALRNPRQLDRRLVDSQEARRVLDRLYGYEVSPVLWKKVLPQLSAGRVQSVATRIVVERERERIQFVAAGYWDIGGTFVKSSGKDTDVDFVAITTSLDGRRIASGRDFDWDGSLFRNDLLVLEESVARELSASLRDAPFAVRSVERKPYRRRPAAPFITSTLQQEAGRKLRMTAKQAMATAQALYEAGYITYMRTDSTTLSQTALTAARAQIEERYGAAYLPDKPRQYTKKVRNAQEAHEAIRPAGDHFKTPAEVASEVSSAQAKLYELVWKRTLASQMTDAVGETVVVKLAPSASSARDVEFSTRGTIIEHQGFRRAYVEGRDSGDAPVDSGEARLPALAVGDALVVRKLTPEGHRTQPPPRYTEASLVKRLEELGVGRPSTYATIMGTIQDRGYVWKKGSAMVPSFTAFAVVGLLEKHFADLVDYAFTARMEEDLDEIAQGRAKAVPWLRKFYIGDAGEGGSGGVGLKSMVSDRLGEIDARAVNSIPVGEDAEGRPVTVRVGRYGPYLVRGEETAAVPEDLPPDELDIDKAVELLQAPSGDRELGIDPESGLAVLARAGRFGPYVQLGEADKSTKKKPKTSSLLAGMQLETVALEDALRLLSLPRVVGKDPADGLDITAQNGRYGPYIKKGTDSRSLENADLLFTITLEQCQVLLATPKRRGRAAAAPLRELGSDPVSGNKMVIKDGRFGPYVTDGETNASLRKEDKVETLTDERASELLVLGRERAAHKKPRRKKTATRKTTKKATRKAATKKPAARKPAAKKPAAKTAAAEQSD